MNNANSDQSYFDWYGKSPSGVEMAIHISVGDLPPIHMKPDDPESELATGADALSMYLIRLDKRLAASGFTRSERLDKPARVGGGGGNWQKPSDPPPADIVVPMHCGEAMKYRAEKKVFDCAKGANCATPRDYQGKKYGASVWERDIREGKV